MKRINPWWRVLAVATLFLLALAGYAWAQEDTGNLYGTVKDQKGAALPGVTLTLSGTGAPQVQVSDKDGRFHFLQLSPGRYHLVSQLEGFSSVDFPNVVISLGRNTNLEITMSSAIEETITVTTEVPLLDTRKLTLGTSISQVELDKIPTARDPWSLMNQTPGVQVDRINVGGNESGQQSVFVGRGANSKANTWAVDGVDISDMSAQGSTPTYFDFGAFQEFQLTTGGDDVTISTSGVTVNVVTKRGTNEWRGSGRYYDTDHSWQSNPSISNSEFGVPPNPARRPQTAADFKPNAIDKIQDYGGEAGGALLKDHIWVWGAYGKNDIKEIAAGTGALDATLLENWNAKANIQAVASNSATLQFSDGNKQKSGRGAGATRPTETTTDQTGPTKIYKVDDTQIFSSNFYLTGLYSAVRGGFSLTPKGGLNTDVWQDADGVYHGSYYFLVNKRDSDQGRADASSFFNTGTLAHELKYGAAYRTATTSSVFGYSNNAVSCNCATQGCNPGTDDTHLVNLYRPSNTIVETKYTSAWAQDTLTLGNLTANLGLRYERESGANKAGLIPGVVKGGVTFMPSINFPGNDPGFTYKTFLPRLGATYALGADRKTLLRGSYARYAEQLGQAFVTNINPAGTSIVTGLFSDLNHNGIFDANEVGTFRFLNSSNFDPAHPTSLISTNRVDPGLKPTLTDEINLGIDHSILPEFVVGAAFTWRHITDVTELQEIVTDASGNTRVATRGDYVPESASAFAGGPTVNYFVLRPGISDAGGVLLTNGPRSQQYVGGSLTFTKRLANHWMARGNVSFNNYTWHVPASYFDNVNPTHFGFGQGVYGVGTPTPWAASGDINGDIVADQSAGSGSKSSVYLNSKYSFNVNGLYQVAPELPWGFDVSANVSGRQGYPFVTFYTVTGSDGIARQVLATSKMGSLRYQNIYTLDGRLDKEIAFSDFGLTLSVDCFNLLNNNTVLQRQGNLGSSRGNWITETVSPRIFRLGATLRFR